MRKEHYILLMYFLLLHPGCRLPAQSYVSKHFSVNEGLPSSECYGVFQDSRHFLWISTDAGVARYDGYSFKTYTTGNGLPDNTVFNVHEDNKGRVWFSTLSGKFAFYSYDKDSIYQIPANKPMEEEIPHSFIDFCFDSGDTLWAAVQLRGYMKIIPPLYRDFVHYRLPEEGFFIKEVTPTKFIFGNDIDPKTVYYKLSAFYFMGYGKPANQLLLNPFVTHIGTNISAIKTGAGQYLFSNSNLGFNVSAAGVSSQVNFRSELSEPVINTYRDSKNSIWLCTEQKGAFRLNDRQQTKVQKTFFPGDVVSCIFEDSDHGYWFTTINNGIHYIPSLKFGHFNRESGLSAVKVYNVAVSENKLYCITSDHKLNVLDLGTGRFTTREDSLYNYVAGFKNSLVLHQMLKNAFHISSTKIYNPGSGRPTRIYYAANGIGAILKNLLDVEDDSLVGFNWSSAIVKVSKHTGRASVLCNVPSKVFSMYYWQGQLFIGTKKGLYRIKNRKAEYLGGKNDLLSCRIEAITGNNALLFLATKGFGVICYKNGSVLQHITENTGLAGNICKCITTDSFGNVWVGTNKGFSRLKRAPNGRYACMNFDLSSGLPSNEINQILEHQGKLYLATSNGIGTFNIDDTVGTMKTIPTYIEMVSVNNIKRETAKHYVMAPSEKFIKINYRGISLKNMGNLLYKYRLEGLDTGWTYTKNTFVQFTTLPPGNYRFSVCAINQNDPLNVKPALVTFDIKAPFWKTTWFYCLVAFGICLIAYLAYNRRIKTIMSKEAQKTAASFIIAQSELKALRAQMNPHFIFNAIHSIQNFVIKNEALQAQKYLTKFAKLIRAVLENSKQETIPLDKEMESLRLYIELEALRASFSFDYELKTESGMNPAAIRIPTMLVQPYIENAILHGLLSLKVRKGRLLVSFSKSADSLLCKVDDNGIGRLAAAEIRQKKNPSHQSMGTSVTNNRIHHLNTYTSTAASVKTIDKYDQHGAAGTIVIIEIRIKNNP